MYMKTDSPTGAPESYEHMGIEKKWQEQWASSAIYKTTDDTTKEKFYVLDMFPYPSGEGLHVGHPKGYIATDIISRMKRMQGKNVLHPMGFDAFGLPAENYAIKTQTHPEVAVKTNVARYKKQLEILGFDYDWSREVNTTDPNYYRWTQWIFLQLYKKGLAFESYEPINWCPVDKTGLANEDIENGRCERCGTLVEKKPMRQWVLKITDYAERLLADLDVTAADGTPALDWPTSIKELQRNWIGRSEGAEITFKIEASTIKNREARVFTTRPDTLFGVTYIVLAPEHDLALALLPDVENRDEATAYIQKISQKSEIERTDATKEKTGVELKGIMAINPVNNEKVPVWIADYVLVDYGTGAVMAVPAHDVRDFQFAKKYNLKIQPVVTHEGSLPVTNHGTLINSGKFDGTSSEEAKKELTSFAGGTWVTKYKLRDWVFSRQRYWGEPIPLIHCEKCGVVAVPESDLPVRLPNVTSYEPTGTGESPLAAISDWVNVKCPTCSGPAKRETNTMPQWAGSSWYYLRYEDPHNTNALVDSAKEKYWSPVDLYVGGAEHATRHLIYARFWHKFLFDIGVVSTNEPFTKLQHVGLIMGEDGRKMSKRFGNVVNPDDIVATYGADTLRVYEMFMGPFDQQIAWNTSSIIGARRFIEKIWRMRQTLIIEDVTTVPESVNKIIHKVIKKVTDDIEHLHFNTAISSLMIATNEIEKIGSMTVSQFEIILKLLAPFAPHITEELYASVGNNTSIHTAPWPVSDPQFLTTDSVTIIIQVNGKVRGSFSAPPDTSKEELEKIARQAPDITKWIENGTIVKVIVVPNRLVNIVIT
jgi:leucyl-tRNA synthetase